MSFHKTVYLYRIRQYRALLFRRTLKDAEDLIDQCQDLYGPLGGKWYGNPKYAFMFPSGARVTIGHMQNLDDWRHYRGKEIHFYGMDEAAEFEECQFTGPLPWVRSTVMVTQQDGEKSVKFWLRPRIMLTCNWEGIGMDWIKQRWRVKCPCPEHRGVNELFWREQTVKIAGKEISTRKSFLFIPGSRDNSVLLERDPEYVAKLALEFGGVDAPRFKALGLGCCEQAKGALFPEANENVHLIPDDFLPKHWNWAGIGGYDYATSEWGDAAALVRLLVNENFDVIVDSVLLMWGKGVDAQAEEMHETTGACVVQYADRDLFAQNQVGQERTIADGFRAAKRKDGMAIPINFVKTSPDRKTIAGAVRNRLKATTEGRKGALYIRKRARRVFDDIVMLKADEKKNFEEWIDQRITITHAGIKRQYHFDAFMAFLHGLSGIYKSEAIPLPVKEAKGIRAKTMERINKQTRTVQFDCAYSM